MSKLHHFLEGPLAWGSPTDQLFVLLLPAASFANTFLPGTVSGFNTRLNGFSRVQSILSCG